MLPASLKVCVACGCTCEIYYIHKPDMSQQAAISVDAVARVAKRQTPDVDQPHIQCSMVCVQVNVAMDLSVTLLASAMCL